MKCEYCEIVERERKVPVVYIDEELVVAVKDKVLAPGQITVFPRVHYTILEMVPEMVLAKCAVVSNKVSMALFEALGCQGTNIIIANGVAAGQSVPHFGIEVVPRVKDDHLNLSWQGKQLSEDDLEISLKALIEDITKASAQRVEEIGKKRKGKGDSGGDLGSESEHQKSSIRGEESSKRSAKNKEGDMLTRSLRRIP